MRRVLRLIGYDPSSPDDQAITPVPRRFLGITVQHILTAGMLKGGEVLVSTNGAWPATAMLPPDGRIDLGGTPYPSPSEAAAAVKRGPANGWEFWAVETATGTAPLATLRARYAETQAGSAVTARPSA